MSNTETTPTTPETDSKIKSLLRGRLAAAAILILVTVLQSLGISFDAEDGATLQNIAIMGAQLYAVGAAFVSKIREQNKKK